jgi:hypothetical protein
MADNFPLAVLADDYPGDLHDQRLGILLDDKGRSARDIDQVGRNMRGPDIGELD